MTLRFRARAKRDLEQIYDYLASRSPLGARNVLRALHGAIRHIEARPLTAPRTSDPAIRVKVLGRYRYKIFYAVIDTDTVEIIHIRHSARRDWEGL